MFDIQVMHSFELKPIWLDKHECKLAFELFGKGFSNDAIYFFDAEYFEYAQFIPRTFNWFYDYINRKIYFLKEENLILFKLFY